MKKYLGIVGLILAVVVVLWQVPVLSQSTITWEGIIPHIYSGSTGDEAINIAMTQSTVGLDVAEESALTNTVQEIMSLTHTTSGTPANGIGLEWVATQETSAGNNEDIGAVQFYMSDTTATSEDASFGIELMAAGAAKAEVFTLGSTGIATLVGGATIDNATSATNLAIAETNVGITGDLTITGDTLFTGGVAYTGCTIAADDATPSVDGCHVLTTSANTGATEITDLDDPVVGAIYILIGGSATNSSTITDGGNFALSAGWTASVDETLTLYVQADNDYVEITRSTN